MQNSQANHFQSVAEATRQARQAGFQTRFLIGPEGLQEDSQKEVLGPQKVILKAFCRIEDRGEPQVIYFFETTDQKAKGYWIDGQPGQKCQNTSRFLRSCAKSLALKI